MKNFGFIPTVSKEGIPLFKAPKSMPVPSKYTYQNYLPPVTDQGDDPYCIPHSVACWINWKQNMKTGTIKDNQVRYEDIYNSKKSQGEGMMYGEAFDYLKTKGVKTAKGIVKISEAGIIPSISMTKAALLANGPCFGALPVYDTNMDEFWTKRPGLTLQGWHSITIVGWNEKGWIIRNSWGKSFGNKGYVVLPYTEEKKFREIWTILG